MLVKVGSVGEKEHPIITALANVDAEVGAAVKVYVRLCCPDSTVCVALPVLTKVKVGGTVTVMGAELLVVTFV